MFPTLFAISRVANVSKVLDTVWHLFGNLCTKLNLSSSFYSQVLQPIGNEDDNHFTIDQEIIDKTKTKNVFNCKAEHEYQEDECLKNCLVDRFIKEVGCLHARLYEFANDTIREEIKR